MTTTLLEPIRSELPAGHKALADLLGRKYGVHPVKVVGYTPEQHPLWLFESKYLRLYVELSDTPRVYSLSGGV